jgi:hypothetical protein
MQYIPRLIFALSLPLVIGCGSDGGGLAGNCGWNGTGGGAAFLAPGLWAAHEDDSVGGGIRACLYVNADCTALTPSAECNVTQYAPEAHFLEIETTAGENERGERCIAGVAVTPDLVIEVPIRGHSFTIELTDAEGGDWRIEGIFGSGECEVEARRAMNGGYCHDSISIRHLPAHSPQ